VLLSLLHWSPQKLDRPREGNTCRPARHYVHEILPSAMESPLIFIARLELIPALCISDSQIRAQTHREVQDPARL
jgi:hypothetical protein